jgi:hypothetical protein
MEKNYLVQEDDSLVSIALKHNVSLYSLLRLNGLCENSIICPGMTLKVEQGEDAPRVLMAIESQQDLNKMTAFYCSKEGDVRGVLYYNEYALTFTPECYNFFNTLIFTPNGLQEVESLDFHQFLDLRDVLSVVVVQYPGFDSKERSEDQLYIKIVTRKTGFEQLEQKKSTPKGTLYFKVTLK